MIFSIQKHAGPFFNSSYLLLLLMIFAACKKEVAPLPSNADVNYLVVKDNPNDAVDHAIFQFYESEGIPCFYNDTIFRKPVGDSAGLPRYFYVRLLPGYSPSGTEDIKLTLTNDKQQIPALLDLLKNDLLPRLPKEIFIPSILIVDSFATTSFPRINMSLADGWQAYHGFNTVLVKNTNIASMTMEERKMYTASMLASMAAKKLMTSQSESLQKDFYSISRELTKPIINDDIYFSFDVSFNFPPPVPAPEEIGFIHYITYYISFQADEYFYTLPPRLEDDVRMYLSAVLYYTTEEFNTKYAGYPTVLNKFRIMKEIASIFGFQLPD